MRECTLSVVLANAMLAVVSSSKPGGAALGAAAWEGPTTRVRRLTRTTPIGRGPITITSMDWAGRPMDCINRSAIPSPRCAS
jgi:hypothetical protein